MQKRLLNYLAPFVLIFFLHLPTFAYEVETHELMSVKAAIASNNLALQLSNLGVKSINSPLKNGGKNLRLIDWVELGAREEDDTFSASFARYRNHFFDPLNGQGFGGILYKNSGIVSGIPSPTWALISGSAENQLYSYPQARQYLLDGLTKRINTDRESNLAKTFLSLGHIAHLIQDAAQPQHTRNDGHGSGSAYELYTNAHRRKLTYSDAKVPAPLFPKTKDFFINTDGTGIAQYSNINFVTEGTNFEGNINNIVVGKTYAHPVPVGKIEPLSTPTPA